MEQWEFTDSFHRADPARVRRLERAMPLDDILESILSVRPKVARIGLKPHPTLGPRIKRVEFCIRPEQHLLDAFFNGPTGYRAEFLRNAPEFASSIDRRVVDRIAAAFHEELKVIRGGLESVAGRQSKVWIRQDEKQAEALLGRTRPLPDIGVRSWIERFDEAVATPRGDRWLARAGVIASLGKQAIDIKGSWLDGGQVVEDAYKSSNRAYQIRTYGFT